MQMRLIICEERYKGTRRQRVLKEKEEEEEEAREGRYFKRLHLEPRTPVPLRSAEPRRAVS